MCRYVASTGPTTECTPSCTCPLWVNNGHRGQLEECPLYPQKRTLELSRGMSALCQKQTSACSFDYFVGKSEELRRNVETKDFGRLEIDAQYKLGRLFHRQLASLRTLQDFVYVVGGAPVHVLVTRPIRHQTTCLD